FQTFISKVVHVLDESLHFTTSAALALLLFPSNLVSRERFPKNCDERPIARQKNAVKLRFLVNVLRGDVETHQRLPRAGDAGNKANRLAAVCSRRFDDLLDRAGRDSQILRTGVLLRNLFDLMAAIKRQCRFDDRWGWMISARFPFVRGNRRASG